MKKQDTTRTTPRIELENCDMKEEKRKFVLAGGGTGGHIYPAIGIAQGLQRQNSEVDLVFIGGNDRLESTLIPQHGYEFLPITVEGFPRSLTWKWFPVMMKVCNGLFQSVKYLKQLKPDVVIGTGGYVSGPVLFAAWLLDIPIAIQEQNVSPGLTNSILARWAIAAFLALPQESHIFPEHIVQITGNPIRPGITEYPREESTYKKYKLDPKRKTVFVMGGSQGSQAVNRAMIESSPLIAKFTHLDCNSVMTDDGSGRIPIQIIHQTGKSDVEEVEASYTENNIPHFVQPYFDNVEEVYSITDLMICRAGGMTVSEITACGIPAIFIPLPAAVGNNQVDNAKSVANAGAAVVLEQEMLTAETLADNLYHILSDKEIYQTMKSASKNLGHPKASQTIAESIYRLVS